MLKKIISYISFKRNQFRSDFEKIIKNLMEKPEVQSLDNCVQHKNFSRLKHSWNVAYVSYIITRVLGLDTESTARGALLHDLYYVDWRDDEYVCEGRNHACGHPKTAYKNAVQLTTLNSVESDIILKHMWLITLTPPSYPESFVVTFVDKFCALYEFIYSIIGGKRKALVSVYVK